jgi:hypothetical protein
MQREYRVDKCNIPGRRCFESEMGRMAVSLAHFGTRCKLAQIKLAKPMAKSLNQTKVNTRKEKEK